MKNILLACGSGIATSTVVHKKIADILDENGFQGQYKITQCKVSEAPAKSASYDFLILQSPLIVRLRIQHLYVE